MAQISAMDAGGNQLQKSGRSSSFYRWSNRLLTAGLMVGTATGAGAESTAAEKRIGVAVLVGTIAVVGIVAAWQIIKERKNKKK